MESQPKKTAKGERSFSRFFYDMFSFLLVFRFEPQFLGIHDAGDRPGRIVAEVEMEEMGELGAQQPIVAFWKELKAGA